MNIQFVRLELDVCEKLNQMALQQRRTVSDLVNWNGLGAHATLRPGQKLTVNVRRR